MILDSNLADYPPLALHNFFDAGFAINLVYDKYDPSGAFTTVSPGFHTWIGIKMSRTSLESNPDFPPIRLFKEPCTRDRNLTVLTHLGKGIRVVVCQKSSEQHQDTVMPRVQYITP